MRISPTYFKVIYTIPGLTSYTNTQRIMSYNKMYNFEDVNSRSIKTNPKKVLTDG